MANGTHSRSEFTSFPTAEVSLRSAADEGATHIYLFILMTISRPRGQRDLRLRGALPSVSRCRRRCGGGGGRAPARPQCVILR